MKVLIPLAGRGSRFVEAGYTVPKPLIQIIKKTMISWTLTNQNFQNKDLIFFVLQKHIDQYQLDKKLKEIFSDEIKVLETLRKQIQREIESTLNLVVKVKLVEPRTIERSMGKAVRVIDNRELYQ